MGRSMSMEFARQQPKQSQLSDLAASGDWRKFSCLWTGRMRDIEIGS
jgi:hypothetical protein